MTDDRSATASSEEAVSGDDRQGTDGEPGDTPGDELVSSVDRDRLVRFGHVVGLVVLVAVVLPFVLYAVPQVIGAEHSYVVLSPSMEPALDAGDVIFVDAVEADAVREGDVITFKRPADERTTTHRVIEVSETDAGERAFRTKGDNNDNADQGVVTAGQLRGRVMHLGGVALAVPLIGFVLQFTSSGPGFALLFVLPMVLLIGSEIWTVVSSAGSDEPAGPATEGQESEGSVGAPPGAEAAVDGGDPVDADPETVSFSPAELRLGVAILAAFVVYSLWVASTDPGAFTVGVAGSAVVALLLLGGLYVQGHSDGSPAVVTDSPEAGVTIRTGDLSAEAAALERESVAALATMVDLAERHGAQLYRTPAGHRYHLVANATLFVYDVGNEDDADGPEEPAVGAGPPDGSAAADGGTSPRADCDEETAAGESAAGSAGDASRSSTDATDDRSTSAGHGSQAGADDD